MGDENDRGAGFRALPQGREEGGRLVGGEDGRGLVEDEDFGGARERSRDLDALARPDGQRFDAVVRPAELEREVPREPRDARPPGAGALEDWSPPVEKREVVRDARSAYEEIVLRNEGDSGVAGVSRPAEGDDPAVAEDLPGVGREASGRDRDERRLAGAVLAEDGVDLAGEEGEVRLGKSPGLAEALRDPPQLESRGRRTPQKFPRGTTRVPARIFPSAAFSSSRTACGTFAFGEMTNETTPLARP